MRRSALSNHVSVPTPEDLRAPSPESNGRAERRGRRGGSALEPAAHPPPADDRAPHRLAGGKTLDRRPSPARDRRQRQRRRRQLGRKQLGRNRQRRRRGGREGRRRNEPRRTPRRRAPRSRSAPRGRPRRANRARRASRPRASQARAGRPRAGRAPPSSPRPRARAPSPWSRPRARASRANRSRATGPVQPPGGAELVAGAAEIVGELARAGVSAGERVLKDLFSRLPH